MVIEADDIRRLVKRWMGKPHRVPQSQRQAYQCVPCRIMAELMELVDAVHEDEADWTDEAEGPLN